MNNLRVSTLVAGLVLFAIIAGSATAASGLISGRDIKKGTITAKQIANRTITTSNLSPGTVKSLKGQRGPAGRPGATGPAGVVDPFYSEANYLDLAGNVLLELDLPAGEYTLLAKADVTSNTAGAYVSCSIWVDEVSAADEAVADPVAMNETVSLSLMAVTNVAAKVDLRCNGYDVSGNARNVKLIAMPVSD
jgi:hypothetical protein